MADTKPKTSPKAIKFLFGGLAGMGATVFVQPLDLVKNRMQLSGQGTKAREYKTSFHALFSILKNEGVGGIYTGLSAGLLRQATYTTTRLGIYTILFEKMTSADGRPPNFLLKVRPNRTLQNPAGPVLQSYIDVLMRVVGREGFFSLWKGFTPYYARLGPHTVLTFIFLEQMNRLYKTYVLDR
ncbi:PREDICTED: mitochondrial 2-oxoglutarate/malate carrier protein-like [Cyprinodon variegatus]|uniref:mitochondrial 2-oxoglutarate/malate carrier protein-like n=1 Tax=Cyprinodon variegatus TaxID=28743 RepID=UPI000742B588|nr:PREDICTED: mitochondrial 2-oxoglutarate/malate carrier protein-like [Cyprinodon variegatus]